jgi:DNA modification methylase
MTPPMTPSASIITADARDALTRLPDNSVHCCVTSPPYYGLRNYQHDGQIGLEPTPEEYVAQLVAIFRELRRVLRPDGTLWLNIGDSYNAYNGNRGRSTSFQAATEDAVPDLPSGAGLTCKNLKNKDLIGIPWRVAFALQDDGWYLRQEIIWSKPNPMPESVTDRCTKAHEQLFLLSKSPRYFYDNEAIKEPIAASTANDPRGNEDGQRRDRCFPGQASNGGTRLGAGALLNKRSVSSLATHPYKEAHFATYPVELITPCIMAGTSEYGCCPHCAAPWERVVEKTNEADTSAKGSKFDAGKTAARDGAERTQAGDRFISSTLCWSPTCSCGGYFVRAHKSRRPGRNRSWYIARRQSIWREKFGAPVPAVVLDPFNGAGTTGLASLNLTRSYIGIALNPEYVPIPTNRLAPALANPCLL